MKPCPCYACALLRILPGYEPAPPCMAADWRDEPTQLGGWDVDPPAYVAIEVRS